MCLRGGFEGSSGVYNVARRDLRQAAREVGRGVVANKRRKYLSYKCLTSDVM